MADDAPDTKPGAVKAYIGALGFIIVLIGAEMMAEKDGARFWIGVLLVIAGLPVMSLAVIWTYIRPWLGHGIRAFILYLFTHPWWLTRALWVTWLFLGYEVLGSQWAQAVLYFVILAALLWWNFNVKMEGAFRRQPAIPLPAPKNEPTPTTPSDASASPSSAESDHSPHRRTDP